jgi:hypothetical protein
MKLITHAVGATTRDKTLGRAEALRRTLVAIIYAGTRPFWAPFAMVGKGAPANRERRCGCPAAD